ncbi:MAG: PEP-CTERM sorting domain-containing protein [Sandarakinorhabdus sp.]|nr:PEP-CTERM sorting domain-containing protein [Sandarakinorhabdus sp.]
MIAAAALMTAAGANAAVILSSNFDGTNVNGNNPNPDYHIYSPSVEGWTSNTNGIELQSNNVAGKAFSGANLVELDTTVNSSMFVTLTPGRYNVSYYYSPRPGVAADSNGITLSLGETLLDSITGQGAGGTVWQRRTVAFNGGGNLTFAAIGSSDGVGGYIDSVKISTVPEASTWVMLVAGFGLVGVSMRRRKAAVAA